MINSCVAHRTDRKIAKRTNLSTVSERSFSFDHADPPMDAQPPELAIPDRAIIAGRWIAAFVGIVSSLPAAERADKSLAYASAFIVGSATWRTFRPFEKLSLRSRRAWLAIEVIATGIAVGVSGAWHSPFTSSLFVVTVLAAVAEDLVGAWLALIAIVVSVLGSGAFLHRSDLIGSELGRLFTPVLVAAVVGVTVRRGVFRLRTEALTHDDELQRLSDTNELMVRLTALTRAGEIVQEPRDIASEAARRLAESFRTDLTTVLQRNEDEHTWVALAEDRAESHGPGDILPSPPLPEYSAEQIEAVLGRGLAGGSVPPAGSEPFTRPGGFRGIESPTLIAPLVVRQEILGAVVLERSSGTFSVEEHHQLATMADVLSLSIDNSRWFRRLRTMGAEAERRRIAREVHDRLASSVAYSAFALERLRKRYSDDSELAKAHEEARTTVGDLRDVLWQLRTGVTPALPLSAVGADLARRFTSRTGIAATFDASDGARLPPSIEVELLRIMQEALNNVEKHAGATEVTIQYRPDSPFSRLRITDNGEGFDPNAVRANDSYGLAGIRERAAAIGATVEINSQSSRETGTEIFLELASDASLINRIMGATGDRTNTVRDGAENTQRSGNTDETAGQSTSRPLVGIHTTPPVIETARQRTTRVTTSDKSGRSTRPISASNKSAASELPMDQTAHRADHDHPVISEYP